MCAGYGDLFPTTALGRLMGVCCMMMGILALALPIGVMGSAFNRNYAKFHGKIEDSLRASVNVEDMSSDASVQGEEMLYELNNEIIVRVEEQGDGKEGDGNCDEHSARDQGSTLPSRASAESTGGTGGPDTDRDQLESLSNGVAGTTTDKEIELPSCRDKQTIGTHTPCKLTNKEIRERLKCLSGEIGLLMEALEDNDE